MMNDSKKRRRLLSSMLVVLAAAGMVWSGTAHEWVARFSQELPGELSADWKAWHFKGKETTEYRLEAREGRTVLAAVSRSSASAVVRKVNIDPHRFPFLTWSWSTLGPIEAPKAGVDDFPNRLFVIFEPRKKGLWSALSGSVKKLGGGFSGKALNYVWAGRTEGEMGYSPASRQVKMISVEAGDSNLGVWVRERRNVYQDYLEAFGERPGRVVAIALMTDTDNSGSQVTSFYGDIHFGE